ncbi:hypothetical protein FGE12_04410 [Aggregicoccus sp. 17bor-14]|uniref:hypothetical protein n=1 Tax=Myxococcaceae TaxID=31 RepID=UPI00129CF14A|nr:MULTISPECIES: hypothetical protein [Myxococcaceae]MBF5041619.1 hypothetical protein [Simulacricoccus sp. 17bor-14]MRI87404.1 hypothetical protein [Aggregicoccus sp. 17bor-14]
MKRLVAMLAVSVLFAGCGEQQEQAPQEQVSPEIDGEQAAPVKEGTLSLQESAGAAEGRFVSGDDVVAFRSREVEPGVFSVDVSLHGLALNALMDPANGAGSLDGFAEANGADTQIVDEDRAVLAGFSAALNRDLPQGDAASPAAKYLRRSVSLWAEHPSSVELERTVLGERGRGYTMLCSYAKCGGAYTGSCSSWNWYSYAKHDCQHGGFDATINQQIAQLGNHGTCSGDEYYYSSGWKCGEPDHWSRPKVYGNCFGRCGGGCGGDTQYTVDATNHDGCVRNGHALASAYCDDQFTSASDDELYAGNCY